MKNILIIKPSSFGDIIQALPVAARLRQCRRDARISWLVNAQYGRLLENNPCVDRIIPFSRHLWKKRRTLVGAISSFVQLCEELRGQRFDTVLDLQGLLRSAFFSVATGSPVRAGFANAREGASLFYHPRVRVSDGEMHAVERYLLLARAVGCAEGAVSFPLGIGESEESWAEKIIAAGDTSPKRPRVGLLPSSRWETKRWPPEHFAALGDALSDAGVAVVLVGGPAGEGADVASMMSGKPIEALDIADPLNMAALLRRLDAVVTNDSGPTHLAAAVGTPAVALFGPTNPRLTAPYGKRHRIICAPVECRPCFKKICATGKDCMRAISVETVKEAVEDVLSKSEIRNPKSENQNPKLF